jgi:UDP-glucose 4-epimerase
MTTILRFGNVYGPNSSHKTSVIAKFIKNAIDGEECVIFGDGSQTRDFIFIEDLVEAICKAIMSNLGGEILQIATGKETSINEIAQIIQKKMKDKGFFIRLSYSKARHGDIKRNFSDTSKASRTLVWSSKTNIENGIEKTIDYFINL